MEIILLRHGKPDTELNGVVGGKEFKQLATAYAKSGIKDFPPESIKQDFLSHHVVCSNLDRSIQSAKRLGLKQINLSHRLFRESDIPHFDYSFIKLPVTVWLVILRIMWLFGFSKNGESFSAAKRRAKKAAKELIELAEQNEKVILVGHGLMNRLIAKQLRCNKWLGPTSPGKKYWEYGTYINLKI